MATDSQPIGRRERNKQQKLDRIVAAASELFAERAVDEVTTQEIAERADIGAGTLFLYAKSKGELLLLVQNSHYADALVTGRAAAAATSDPLEATMALLRPIVSCNRENVDNGRFYLREMIFGDATEPHHARALSIIAAMESELAGVLLTREQDSAETAPLRARAISAALFLCMASPENLEASVNQVVAALRDQVAIILGVSRRTPAADRSQ